MNLICIGIIIGMPVGIIAWLVGGYLRDKYRKEYCEMCGSASSDLSQLHICERCIDRLGKETKKSLIDKMFKEAK